MNGQRFALDFTPRRRVAPLAWLLLSAGITLSAAAGLFARQAWLEHVELRDQLARIERALAREGQASRPAQASSSERALSDAARGDAQRIWADLRRPWNDLFDHLQASAQPPVRLLQVAVDSRFSEMQLQAEARSLDDVFRLADALGARAPIVSARLVSHEWRTMPSGQRVVTARVNAVLKVARTDDARAPSGASAHGVDGTLVSAPGAGRREAAGSR